MKLPKLTTIFNIFAPIFFLVIIGFLIYYIIKRNKLKIIITTVILILFLGLFFWFQKANRLQKIDEDIAEKKEELIQNDKDKKSVTDMLNDYKSWKKESEEEKEALEARLEEVNSQINDKKTEREEKKKLLKEKQKINILSRTTKIDI
ncbi:hypothetical protein [Candidatus Phytoplasma pruni]|uniref:Uncharacterized protein n=1 Tax=Candidatus Phytoplasma pruni TaxID=479893 RepID=A0A851HCF3_9MOLU|nr:hypothetical protein [Candidatus Phytoplasma pruni]NWN45731.1 hypothetical protein [Candidatus Phytoplasma pruni]